MIYESCLRDMDGDEGLGVVSTVDQEIQKGPSIGFRVSMNLLKWFGEISACALVFRDKAQNFHQILKWTDHKFKDC